MKFSNLFHKRFLIKAIPILLILVLSVSVLNLPQVALATTTGSNVVSGIDYSGQGTKINNDIRGTASKNGNYVTIPTWTYGAYVYSTWDEFWAGWSDWSPNFKSYYDQKGYDYNNQHKICVTDAEKKTEYLWYRNWTKKRDVYRTKYYRKYKGKGFFHWGHTDSSWSGYPANKGCCPSTTYTKNEKYGTENYIEREDYGKYSDSAPFRWPWDPSWVSHSPRLTYRYKAVDLSWDPTWKNESSESCPLNYSLYKLNGTDLGLGIKWSWDEKLSTDKKSESSVFHYTNKDVTEYYLTVNEAQDILMNKILLQALSVEDEFYQLLTEAIISLVTFPVHPLTGFAVFLLTTVDGLSEYAQLKGVRSVAELIIAAKEMNQVIKISVVYDETVYYGGGYSSNSGVYVGNYNRTSVSMFYKDNNPSSSRNIFGRVTYLNNNDIKNIVGSISTVMELRYGIRYMYNGI